MIILLVLFLVGLGLLTIAVVYSTRKREIEEKAWSPPPDRGIRMPGEERMASPVSEEIEAIVRARMRQDPALKYGDLDFGTAEDGGLEIWLDGERHEGVDDLPDSRLKALISQAVEQYNLEQSGGEK
jgi:hypothetical protein